ncbi:EF-hand domain-containing protein [Erythrobacter sp. THAF29]|uniref:EF-hand domain-containing protein n=1 Tax=Erythrobacter sp. THAF29 TaxID=2587851 RepID=UPI001267FC50|nr:EF-hand domain-containing protein [Erythrobacter sp. THAF29]QFT77943.1 EF hand [Erythrobacter sp. THAF29]
MRQTILGVFVGLLLAGVGMFWWQGRAQVEINAPPPPEVEEVTFDPEELPITDPGEMEGPAPPEASELTREEKRFFRYDRNRDRKITRNEMLSSRSEGFRKLDTDGNNLLTFEEWAVTTATRFDAMDADGNAELTQSEFSTSAPKPSKKRTRCSC